MRDALKTLNLRDLSALSALVNDASVTKAAARLGQSQPMMSRTLRRLRGMLGDPLLVRSGTHMVQTERAQQLREPLREILAQVARLDAGAGFDPQRDVRTFGIACADCLPPALLPTLVARLVGAGPGIQVRIRLIDPAFDVGTALDDGGIDLVVNNSPRPREDLRVQALFTDEVVCLVRKGHPLAEMKRLSLATYLQAAHLAPSPSSMRELGPVDGELARAGYRRRIVATIPEFNQVPLVLTQTDLIFTTGLRFASHHAAQMQLGIVRAPEVFPPMRFYQLWHEREHTSPANRWLRQMVLEASQAVR
ncbi:MAG: LysR family transcriptional regulator [Rubrivivax sp.]